MNTECGTIVETGEEKSFVKILLSVPEGSSWWGSKFYAPVFYLGTDSVVCSFFLTFLKDVDNFFQAEIKFTHRHGLVTDVVIIGIRNLVLFILFLIRSHVIGHAS